MKKFLAFMLALMMITSLACVPVSAEDVQPAADQTEEVVVEPDVGVPIELPPETTIEFIPGPVVGPDSEADTDEEPAFETTGDLTDAADAVYVEEDVFADWNPDAPALNTLIDYVTAVTDKSSADYIPVEDRVAVFDMDGTLYAELFPTYLEYYMLAWRILKDPSISPDAEMLELGREIRESVINHSFASDMPMRHAIQAARAYAGLTPQEFADFVTSVLVRPADGFEGMSYATAFYTPMIEVIEYLRITISRSMSSAAVTVPSAVPSSRACSIFPITTLSAWMWTTRLPTRATRTDWTMSSRPMMSSCARTDCSSRT